MGTGFENMKQYGEKMIGKFSHKPHGNGIVISVTNPFVEEICIDVDNDFYREYSETYLHLEPQATDPDIQGIALRVYYNTQDKCYYKSQWGTTEESGWGCTWVETDRDSITTHVRRSEQLQALFRRYSEIHKGQLCYFTAYAVDPKGDPTLPSIVESMFDRHKWFYNPFSFEVELLDQDTIDDFVAETPISKEMTDKMVLHHKEQAEIKRQKEEEDKKKKKDEKRAAVVNKITAHFEKYEKIYKYGLGGGILWFISILVQLLIIIFNR